MSSIRPLSLLPLVLAAPLAFGAAPAKTAGADAPEGLRQAQALHSRHSEPRAEGNAVTGLRRQSQHHAALALGVSQGLADRSREIRRILKRHARLLDRAFNFAVLMDSNVVVPPVVRLAENVYAQEKPDILRISRQVIRVVREARLAPGPLTWRSYLEPAPVKIYEVPSVLLPVDEAEQKNWRRWVAQGYRQGVRQADAAFQVALNRLVRDYHGMLEYRRLVALGKLQPAIQSVSERGVVIDDKKRLMRVQDTVRVLSKPVRFAPADKWQVIIDDD